MCIRLTSRAYTHTRQSIADTKQVPGPTYYNPRLGMADSKDVYSRTNLKTSIKYSFGKAVLPWQKKDKPTPGAHTAGTTRLLFREVSASVLCNKTCLVYMRIDEFGLVWVWV